MAHTSETGLAHRGFVCEELDGSLFEEVYDDETNPAATVRWCRVCGAHRSAVEDAYGRTVAGHEPTVPDYREAD